MGTHARSTFTSHRLCKDLCQSYVEGMEVDHSSRESPGLNAPVGPRGWRETEGHEEEKGREETTVEFSCQVKNTRKAKEELGVVSGK